MPRTPPQTDTYNTALDIFDRTHPLRVDVNENLKVTIASSGGITIGTVDQGAAGSQSWLVDVTNVVPVTGTFFQAVQPVSGTIAATQSGTWTVAVNNFPATQSVSGTVAVSNFPAVQPISGTVTATPPALPSSAIVGQTKIAVTGTAVQLSNGTLVNGVVLSASLSNVASITIGGSGVNNTVDGTGNGYILQPGASIGIAVNNTNVLYVNGTAGDVVAFVGS